MPRVNDMLAALLIADISEFLPGVPKLKYSDRLTRDEARQIIAVAQSHPTVVKALISKAHPEHETVQLFNQMVRHFANEHPQVSGEPAAWPTRGARPAGDPANKLSTFFPDEAEAWTAWAKTRTEYREAFGDGAHPRHAEMVGLMHAATTIATSTPEAPIDAPAVARPDEGPRDMALATSIEQRATEARKDPAYADARHPQHAAAVERVNALYREGYPEPSGAAAEAAAPPRSPAAAPAATIEQRLAEARRHPAWNDGRHPEHAAAVERVSAINREAYPEPAPAATERP